MHALLTALLECQHSILLPSVHLQHIRSETIGVIAPNISVSACFHEHRLSAGFCSSTSITTSHV